MKNKHLVLLFLGIVALGGISRFCRFSLGTKLDAVLFKKPLAEIDKIWICRKDTTILTRTAEHWLISQKEDVTTVPDSVVTTLLQLVGSIRAIELVHSDRPDTLGLGFQPQKSIVCSSRQWDDQVFFVGNTVQRGGAVFTWVGLPRHEQYYLTPGDLNAAFNVAHHQYAPGVRMHTDTAGLCQVQYVLRGDTLLHMVRDSGRGSWLHPPFGPKDTVSTAQWAAWKQRWQSLCDRAVAADFFDKRSTSETFCGELRFYYEQFPQRGVNYRLFYVRTPVLPDDPEKRRYFRNFKPQYLFESDLQPGFYFSVSDSLTIHQLNIF